MRGLLIALAGVLAAFSSTDAVSAERAYGLRSVPPADVRTPPPQPRGMVFRLGRRAGSPACGLGCAEFIVAEGDIRRDSAEALAILANRLKRPLPVIFNSPGGSLDGGLALGRVLQHYRLDTVVARMVPASCEGNGCEAVDRRSGVTVYEDAPHPADCNSACVYSFLGGKTRVVEAGSSLGVHRFYLADSADPRRKPLTQLSAADRARLDESVKELAFYLVEMGISSELLTLASSVEPQQIRKLTLAEMTQLGVTTDIRADIAVPEPAQPLPNPTTRIGDTLLAAPTTGWPVITRDGKPYAVLAMPAESRRFGEMTAEVAIGCGREAATYEANIREIVAGRALPPEDARLRVLSAPETTGALSRATALSASRSGILAVEVVSAATAGYPQRIDFPAEGLASAVAELDRACAAR